MTSEATGPAPRSRRAYFDCLYGQLHVHNAAPGGGGFDELTTVICVHGAGESGRVFDPVLQLLGKDRSAFAPDLPGCGESDAAHGVDFTAAGVQAIADFIASMRFRSFDLVARAAGCDIAVCLARQPQSRVRRLVLLADDPPGKVDRAAPQVVLTLPLSGSQLSALGPRLVQALSA